jgi:hypothetical protein
MIMGDAELRHRVAFCFTPCFIAGKIPKRNRLHSHGWKPAASYRGCNLIWWVSVPKWEAVANIYTIRPANAFGWIPIVGHCPIIHRTIIEDAFL